MGGHPSHRFGGLPPGKPWKVYPTKSSQYHDRNLTIVVGTVYKEKPSQEYVHISSQIHVHIDKKLQNTRKRKNNKKKNQKEKEKSNPPWLRALMQ